MKTPADFSATASAILGTLSVDAQTLVRRPRSTIVPPRPMGIDGALAVLQRLRPQPDKLVDAGLLGRGGMGEVRLATQVALNRKVAVKSLREDRRDPASAEALVAEAWVAGALEHPSVVPVHDLTVDEQGLPVLVMKRIEGQSWGTLLSDPAAMATWAPGRTALDAHLRILMQVCNVVHFAHARGVVHRDLKPDNVMLGNFGEVYVVDWGIATSAGPSSQLAGTPAYMAPEMLGGDGAALSPQTDVYLLGSVLHEVVAGTPPHHGASAAALVESVLRSTPRLPDSAPAELAALITSCLQRRPEDRPATALAVREALDDYQAHQGSRELAAQSERSLAELLASLPVATTAAARVGREGAAPEVTQAFSLFSACRFGFQQALLGWPGNAQARAGLERAITAMARFELARGAALSAQTLVRELVSPDVALEQDVAAAVAKELEEAQQLGRLKLLEAALDPRTGSALRSATATGIALLWMVAPLMGNEVARRWPQWESLASVPIALLSALIVSAVARRSRDARTPLNRQLGRVVIFTMLVQAVGSVAARWWVGDAGPTIICFNAAYWFLVAGVVAASLLPEIWPSSLAYLACLLGTLRWPEHRYWLVSGANAVFCLNGLSIQAQLRKRPAPPLP